MALTRNRTFIQIGSDAYIDADNAEIYSRTGMYSIKMTTASVVDVTRHNWTCLTDTTFQLLDINYHNMIWRHNCSKCLGKGYTPDGLLCEKCTQAGKCPRCMVPVSDVDSTIDLWITEHSVCPSCGWDWGRGKHDLRPELPVCTCASTHDLMVDDVDTWVAFLVKHNIEVEEWFYNQNDPKHRDWTDTYGIYGREIKERRSKAKEKKYAQTVSFDEVLESVFPGTGKQDRDAGYD